MTQLAFLCCALHLGASILATSPAPHQRSFVLRSGSASFAATATLGDFTGTTTAVLGRATGLVAPLSASGFVEVRLDSLRTGNSRRDGHMRDALDVSRFPVARFRLDSLVATAASSGAGRNAAPSRGSSTTTTHKLYGAFNVHGVSRDVVADATITSPTAGEWDLFTTFPVTLADHGISKGLSRLLGTIKVGPVVQVTVTAEFGAG